MSQTYSKQEFDQFRKMRVVILTPMMHVDHRFIPCVVNMTAHSWHHGLRICEMGYTSRVVVDWARNSLARAAMEQVDWVSGEPFTHFLWLDSDHAFKPDLACQLARSMRDPEIDAITAVYYAREAPYYPVVYVKDETPNEYAHYPIVIVPPHVFECDACGFGAVLIKREVFAQTPEPWFTLDYRGGEDLAFCVQAKKAGFKFFCDGSYVVAHAGEPPLVTQQTNQQYMKDHPEVMDKIVRVGLGGKINGPNIST